jgi:hypothetical protein
MRISTALIAVCALGPIHGAVSTEARADDRKAPTAETTVMTDKARQLEEAPKPIPDAGPKKAIVVSGAALTGIGLGVGVVLAVLSSGKGADADAQLAALTQSGSHGICQTHTSECDSIDSARRGRDSLAKGAMVSFIGAGAAGLATLGYVWLTPKGPRSTAVKVIPAMALGYGGVSVVGAW